MAKNREIAVHRLKFKKQFLEKKQSWDFISQLKNNYNDEFLTLEKKLSQVKSRDKESK